MGTTVFFSSVRLDARDNKGQPRSGRESYPGPCKEGLNAGVNRQPSKSRDL